MSSPMTNPISTSTTLAEIVNTNPSLARTLERHSLDYCCGGGRTLAEASAEAGVDAQAVADELAAVTTVEQAEWRTLPPDELVDHLEATHHTYLHDELPRLHALVDKVVGVHGERHPELLDLQQTFEALRADLEPHLMKEEQVLFPMIRELARSATAPAFHCGSLSNPISVMLTEHDRAGDLLARQREIAGGYDPPDDACASFRELYRALAELEADTHLHVHKENNLLFPAVVELERQAGAATTA